MLQENAGHGIVTIPASMMEWSETLVILDLQAGTVFQQRLNLVHVSRLGGFERENVHTWPGTFFTSIVIPREQEIKHHAGRVWLEAGLLRSTKRLTTRQKRLVVVALELVIWRLCGARLWSWSCSSVKRNMNERRVKAQRMETNETDLLSRFCELCVREIIIDGVTKRSR
jgi:hypothetical protein